MTSTQSEDRRGADMEKEGQSTKDSGFWQVKKEGHCVMCGQTDFVGVKPSNRLSNGSSDPGHPGGGSGAEHVASENDNALRSEISTLRSENDGLKAKVIALEENIELHKKYKTEAQAEMERLQKSQATRSHGNDHVARLRLEKEARDAQSRSKEYERTLTELRAQLREKQRTEAERGSRDVETKVKELEKRIAALEEMAGEAEAKAEQAHKELREARQHEREATATHASGRTTLEKTLRSAGDHPDRVGLVTWCITCVLMRVMGAVEKRKRGREKETMRLRDKEIKRQ